MKKLALFAKSDGAEWYCFAEMMTLQDFLDYRFGAEFAELRKLIPETAQNITFEIHNGYANAKNSYAAKWGEPQPGISYETCEGVGIYLYVDGQTLLNTVEDEPEE